MYREENDQVILTMSREDYIVLTGLFYQYVKLHLGTWTDEQAREFCDRLNSGNPNYTPYQVGEKNGQR